MCGEAEVEPTRNRKKKEDDMSRTNYDTTAIAAILAEVMSTTVLVTINEVVEACESKDVACKRLHAHNAIRAQVEAGTLRKDGRTNAGMSYVVLTDEVAASYAKADSLTSDAALLARAFDDVTARGTDVVLSADVFRAILADEDRLVRIATMEEIVRDEVAMIEAEQAKREADEAAAKAEADKPAVDIDALRAQVEEMTVKEMRAVAKKCGVPKSSKMNRADLVAVLTEAAYNQALAAQAA